MAREKFEEAIRLFVETDGEKGVDELRDALTRLGQGSDAAAARAEKLSGELQKLSAVSANIRAFTKLKGDLTETGAELEAAKLKLASLTAELDAAGGKATDKLSGQLARAAADVTRLTKEFNVQTVAITKAGRAIEAAGHSTSGLGKAYEATQAGIQRVTREASSAAQAMGRTDRESRKAAQGVSSIDRAARSSAASLAGIATRLGTVSGAAIAAVQALASLGGASVLTGAIKSAISLEDALSQVQAVTGATSDEVAKMKQASELWGPAMRFTALEAAQGLGELARASGSVDEAIAQLPATLQLARGAGLGVADAAGILSTTLTQFGLSGTEAARVADLLAKEANSTQDSVQQLGNAMSYVAPLAKQLGLSVDQTTAILGALADEGYRGERAGTALRATFSALLDPANGFSKALRDLNIDTSSFASIIEGLAKAGDRGKDALLELDTEARPAITSLVSKGGLSIRQLELALKNAGGEAERTALKMGQNVAGAIDKVGASFDRARRALVEPILGPLRSELSKLADDLESVAASPEFVEIQKAFKDVFLEAAAGARSFIQEVDFRAIAVQLRDFLRDTDGSLTAFRENVSLVIDAIQVLWQTFQVVFNGLQTIVLGAAGVITGAMTKIAQAIDGLTAAPRAVLEALGAIEDGQYSLAEATGGLAAVTQEFMQRASKNAAETASAVEGFGEIFGEAAGKAAAASGAAADASTRATGATKAQAAAAAIASEALAKQAAAADQLAASSSRAADEAKETADRLKQAYADLGIKSQQDLAQAASAAKTSFDLIRQAAAAGKASADDVRRALSAYAQAAQAAVADSVDGSKARVDAELRTLAAITNSTEAYDRLGAAGESAGQRASAGAGAAAAGWDNAATAASGADQAVEGAAESSGKAADEMEKASKEGEQFALAMFAVSNQALAAYMATNRFAGMGEIWANMVNRVTDQVNDQGKALRAQLDSINKDLEQFDEDATRRAELQGQYNMLGDSEVEPLLQAQKRLEQAKDQAAAKRRAQDEKAAQDLEAARTAAGGAQQTVAIARVAQEQAEATAGVLQQTVQAAEALSAAAQVVKTATAATGEVVIRIVSETPRGATPVTLSDSDMRRVVQGVVRELKAQRAVAS